MKTETADTIKKIQDLSIEVSSWEMRLSTIKGDIDSLKRQKEQLLKEMSEARSVFNQDMEQRLTLTRKGEAAVEEARRKIEAEKESLKTALAGFQKDVDAVTNDKAKAKAMMDEAQKMMVKANTFIAAVRNASAVL